MNKMRRIWTALFLTVAFPTVASAQDVKIIHQRGWIGLTVDYMTTVTGEEERTVVVVRDVVGGSPAEAAGLEVGDLITHLDGKPFSQEVFTSLTRSLEPGDLVRMTVSRANRDREVLVEAGAWPASITRPERDVGEMMLKLDSVRGAILKNLDSLRISITGVELDSSGELSFQVMRIPAETAGPGQIGYVFRMYEPAFDSLTFTPGVFSFTPDVALPFEAVVVHSEVTDSLKGELKRIRSALTDVRRRELTRIREIQAALQGGNVEREVRDDELIQKLREEEQALVQEQELLNERIRRVSEVEIQRRWVDAQAQLDRSLELARVGRERSGERLIEERESSARQAWAAYERAIQERNRRPLTPLIVGQDFVAGAQIKPLTPWLAEVFEVDEGVVVWEVLEGTPAYEAGLMGGDVIIRVGGEAVSSVDDLRFGFGYLKGPLRIHLIRKGEPVELLVGR